MSLRIFWGCAIEGDVTRQGQYLQQAARRDWKGLQQVQRQVQERRVPRQSAQPMQAQRVQRLAAALKAASAPHDPHPQSSGQPVQMHLLSGEALCWSSLQLSYQQA